MTSIFITLDSETAIVDNSNNRSDDFITSYYQGIEIPESNSMEWGIALIRGDVWNSIPNISDNIYGNATFDYSIDGGVTFEGPFIIDEGTYSIEDINDFIHGVMFDNGHYGGVAANPIYAIEIISNFQTLKADIFIKTPPAAGDPGTAYQLDLTVGLLYKLLGFTAPILIAADTSSNTKVDITFGVNQISINLDIIENGASWGGTGNTGDTVYTYNPDVPPGSLIQIIPNNPVFLKVSRDQIKRIRCYFLDSLGRPVDFRLENNTLTFEIRRFKKL